MSRVGNNPVKITDGVTVQIDGSAVKVKGSKGELALELASGIEAKVEDGQVVVSRSNDEKPMKALHGTMRSLIANMVEGVSKGYKKQLEIHGVGYKAEVRGNMLVMSLGYSHPVEYMIPDGVTITAPKPDDLIVESIDKHLVGQAADRIRSFAPAEPYKGKGIRYKGERIRRKAGKTVA